MKSKIKVREIFLHIIPWLHCTLIFAPLYTIVAVLVYSADNDGAKILFFKALLFFIPTALVSLATERLKHLWQYAVAAGVIIVGTYFISRDWIAVAAIAIMAVVKLAGRARETGTVFDAPHIIGSVLFVIPFIYSGIKGNEFLQLASVILAVIYLVMNFAYGGIVRVKSYVELNEKMANFPGKRINKSGGVIFAAAASLLLLLLIPIIILNYSFVSIDLKNAKVEVKPYEYTQEDEAAGGAGSPDWMAAADENIKPWIDFKFVGDILMVAGGVGFVALIIFGIYALSKNFARTVTEKNDVIESTNNDYTEKFSGKANEQKIRVLDFSPNAVIRRKYIKTIRNNKKESPKIWQTPKEIESLAGVGDERLHELYEKARYSPKGCTKEDRDSL